jgi:hypothetical protein
MPFAACNLTSPAVALTAADLCAGFIKCAGPGVPGIKMNSAGFNSFGAYLETIASGADVFVNGLTYVTATGLLTLALNNGTTFPVTIPHTSKTVVGLVNLVDLQHLGDGRKVFDVSVEVGNTSNHDTDSTGVGKSAGFGNTTANLTAIGSSSGLTNSGANTTAIGVFSAQNNTGGQLTAAGISAGAINSGTDVTAIGGSAGRNNTGNNLVAVGESAGRGNTNVNVSVVGNAAGQGNIGYNLSAIGLSAGQNNQGNNVSGVGVQAAYLNTGSDVSALGYGAAQSNTFNNSSAIGAFSVPTAANQVMLGNNLLAEVRTVGAYFGSAFNVVSDQRNKREVKPIDAKKAIEFASGLNWVSYELLTDFYSAEFANELAAESYATQLSELKERSKDKEQAAAAKAAIAKQIEPDKLGQRELGRDYGLIAQEVQKLTESLGIFGEVVVTGPGGSLSLNYRAIDAIVSRAVQAKVFGK